MSEGRRLSALGENRYIGAERTELLKLLVGSHVDVPCNQSHRELTLPNGPVAQLHGSPLTAAETPTFNAKHYHGSMAPRRGPVSCSALGDADS